MKTNQLTDQILRSLSDIKGQYTKVAWKSEAKPAAAHKGRTLEKKVQAVCRAGVNFANLSTVKEGIANGERGEVQALPWGEWKQFPHVITHKGQDYMRLYPSPNNPVKATYYVDGQEVSKEEYAAFLTPSAAKKLFDKSSPECFTVKASNLIEA